MKNQPLPRIDENLELQAKLLPFCRLKKGETWEDQSGNFRVGCLDIAAKQVFYRMDENVNGCYAQKPFLICLN